MTPATAEHGGIRGENPFSNCRLLTFGEVFVTTFRLFFKRFDVFTSFYALSLAPLLGVGILAVLLEKFENATWFQILLVVVYLMYFCLALVAAGAVVYTAACVYPNDNTGVENAPHVPSFGKAMRVGLKSFPSIACASLPLSMIVIVLMGIVFSLPFDSSNPVTLALSLMGVYVCIVLYSWIGTSSACLVPLIVLEHKGPCAALRHSFGLAYGHYWYIVCLQFCIGVVMQGLLVICFGLSLLPAGPFGAMLIIVSVVMVSPSLPYVLNTIIYLTLKGKKENISVQETWRLVLMTCNEASHGTTERDCQIPVDAHGNHDDAERQAPLLQNDQLNDLIASV